MITFVVENLILMILFPHAKINIGLNVLSKRTDGYHEISSVFYPLKNCCDILEITESSHFSFETTGIEILKGENLCEKAFHLLKKDFAIANVHMHLHKQIPIGAGLGGGSADATFTLRGLNDLFSLGISQTQLTKYALNLGADCPFFIEDNPKYVEGIGEKMTNIHLDLNKFEIRVVNPEFHISTAKAYTGIIPKPPSTPLIELIKTPIKNWKENIKNDFEESVFKKHPELEKMKAQLYKTGAIYASMSGSGSVLYGIFEK
ncbi:MAG: 4-(cytidine 5'-diphospho)-2-C-methyl-D-erythritol kinase [Bacteroidota bacterium]|nr:4-(cytidine 5'-diphospho)-2-C-methyl-D-erythritol kinase [Bacteroidota bacterium]